MGTSGEGGFVFDLIRTAQIAFVEERCRDEITLLGSGGLIAAEHVPKAIIAGLDAVVLDTPLLVALQARFEGEFVNRETGQCYLPKSLTVDWGVQRINNLVAAWRDQLLEILGAMVLREVRRLRGEMGRAMFQADLEKEAFAGIQGYVA
jgi:glutamate synthase domain-containing protein 2